MTDAEVAMACDAWLAATDMTGTIFADGWPEKTLFWPNAPTTPGVMILPRVEVRYMTIQPQQLPCSGVVQPAVNLSTCRRWCRSRSSFSTKRKRRQIAWRGASCSAHALKEVLLDPGFMPSLPAIPTQPIPTNSSISALSAQDCCPSTWAPPRFQSRRISTLAPRLPCQGIQPLIPSCPMV